MMQPCCWRCYCSACHQAVLLITDNRVGMHLLVADAGWAERVLRSDLTAVRARGLAAGPMQQQGNHMLHRRTRKTLLSDAESNRDQSPVKIQTDKTAPMQSNPSMLNLQLTPVLLLVLLQLSALQHAGMLAHAHCCLLTQQICTNPGPLPAIPLDRCHSCHGVEVSSRSSSICQQQQEQGRGSGAILRPQHKPQQPASRWTRRQSCCCLLSRHPAWADRLCGRRSARGATCGRPTGRAATHTARQCRQAAAAAAAAKAAVWRSHS